MYEITLIDWNRFISPNEGIQGCVEHLPHFIRLIPKFNYNLYSIEFAHSIIIGQLVLKLKLFIYPKKKNSFITENMPRSLIVLNLNV